MFSLPRRWLLTAVSASLLGCEAESVAPVAARPEPLPQAGRLPEPTPSAGGEAGDEGGEPGVDDGEPTTPPDLPAEVPEEVGPPEDYGQIKPPVPVPAGEALTVHAMAGYEVVTVYSQPDIESPKLGYMRIGTRMMVAERIDGEGCKSGFYALPAGGFACASKGLVVDREKEVPSKYPPPAPRLDHPLPYDYGFVRRWSSPMWWRIPSDQELVAMEVKRAEIEKQRLAAAAEKGAAKAELPSEPSEPLPEVPPEVSQAELLAMKLPLSPDTPWLERGFFLSLGDKVTDAQRTYYRTARGAYVAAGDVSRYEAKDFQGVPLGEMSYPFGYTKKETKLIELTADNKLKAVKNLERRVFVDLDEETEIGGKAYMITADRMLIRKDHLLIPEPQALPKGLEPWERWIDVSLSKQLLVAYEGTRPVYTTLVSTGRKGSKEEPYDTPTGRWRINSKHISTTMDGNSASDGNYSIQDVPWTMFFFGSYALHGAFWHKGFGAVRSHGCVNLGPSDARWLFLWTTPFLPEGWHGVNATDESPGSTVIVHE
ncbi:MAG: L,D-transpeptidase [Nannocystis sp.]|uniref:L,D-transpeptidase n=1 Tax=Nannocystis sp. TaxID=1962667 RepID=UPI00242469E9|nr:L,D-transpeptidase [Nannocystis sp.]MBK9753118.1 L,D-transpeptidase [Nannocystis sp.]